MVNHGKPGKPRKLRVLVVQQVVLLQGAAAPAGAPVLCRCVLLDHVVVEPTAAVNVDRVPINQSSYRWFIKYYKHIVLLISYYGGSTTLAIN